MSNLHSILTCAKSHFNLFSKEISKLPWLLLLSKVNINEAPAMKMTRFAEKQISVLNRFCYSTEFSTKHDE